jgi:hypothetical protein
VVFEVEESQRPGPALPLAGRKLLADGGWTDGRP